MRQDAGCQQHYPRAGVARGGEDHIAPMNHSLLTASQIDHPFVVNLAGLMVWDGVEKDMHEQVREEARDLMKMILERNSEYEGRRVRASSSVPLILPR